MSGDLFMLGMALHYGLVSKEEFAEGVAEALKPGAFTSMVLAQRSSGAASSAPGDTDG